MISTTCSDLIFSLCDSQVMTCPNASFTDLAEIVSRIEPVKQAIVDGESGCIYLIDYLSMSCNLPHGHCCIFVLLPTQRSLSTRRTMMKMQCCQTLTSPTQIVKTVNTLKMRRRRQQIRLTQ